MTDVSDISLASEYTVDIAGVRLRARASGPETALVISSNLARFVTSDPVSDLTVTVHYEVPPLVSGDSPEVFDSGGVWRLYRTDGGYTFTMGTPVIDGGRPYRVVHFDDALTEGQLYVRPMDHSETARLPDGRMPICPWEYPLDELLVVNKIADGSGVNIHGCAVMHNGVGHLMVGVSGAGKSTLAELWKPRGVPILSDDRIIVRPNGGRMFVHGTPWHGDAQVSLNERAPLANLYFIVKSDENYLRRLSGADALTRLVVRCFPTLYFKVGMENTMSLLSDIAASVPAYEFGFLPDQSAIDFLMKSWD
jgi:hypothetical protein